MSTSPNSGTGSPNPYINEYKSEERGLCMIHLLMACGNLVACGNNERAETALAHIAELASVEGDTMQRIASYFAEALTQRVINRSWPGLHRALNSTKTTSVSEEIVVRRLFFEILPFLKMAYVLTHLTILEAMEDERMVHVIDLNANEPEQWVMLMQAFKSRPEGPPHLRITGIHHQKEYLDRMAYTLVQEAEKLDIPFQFNPVVSKLDDLDFDKLRVKTGEALAICSVLQLHTLLGSHDELRINISISNGFCLSSEASSSSSNSTTKIDDFLRTLRSLSPKIMVVTEQDSDHNGATLMDRMLQSLYSYAAMFDCLEATLARASVERLRLEKMMFGEEIKNIIACEGAERKERHEKVDKWVQRLDSAGFGSVGFSCNGMFHASRLIQVYKNDGVTMKQENGNVLMGWHERSLYSVSAWTCRK